MSSRNLRKLEKKVEADILAKAGNDSPDEEEEEDGGRDIGTRPKKLNANPFDLVSSFKKNKIATFELLIVFFFS